MKVQINKIIEILKEIYPSLQEPIVTEVAREGNPFFVLISTILSLRTKDKTTKEATQRLLSVAKTPNEMLKLTQEQIAKLIYPVGFYNVKAKNILEICKILVEKYDSKVPDSIDDLLSLPNVGRKTANLVLSKGFNIPAICVDIHVHRISNRLGIVKTKTPVQTEFELMKVLPKKYWIEYNDLLVPFGQNICMPISPFCSKCKLSFICPKIGVKSSR
ncbi:endonuclease III domain-containing protein [Desulfurella multipotens]|uniref:endonuclease III domain-containing protein n=1 Tax=Desulfurella TaxID=33001 RepID=UPI000CBAB03B|nr:endonuclease III [Desulfurella multipotens]PMP64091.1 MAG: endonuclease III [Desulfurella multipotens]